MKEVTKKKNSGLAMYLIQMLIYSLLVAIGAVLLTKVRDSLYEFNIRDSLYEFIMITGWVLVFDGSLFFLLQVILCICKKRSKGANVASIVCGALHSAALIIMGALFYVLDQPYDAINDVYIAQAEYFYYFVIACLSIFGIIGGVQGIRYGIVPTSNKRLHAGFACRLTQAVLYVIYIIPFATCAILFEFEVVLATVFVAIAVLFLLLAVLQFAVAFKGKKSKGANVASIIFNTLFALCVIGLPGFIGGIQGLKYLKVHPEGYIPKPKKKKEKVVKQVAVAQSSNGADDVASPSLDTVDYSMTNDSGEILLLSSNPSIVDLIRSAMSGENVDVNAISIFAPDGDELDAQVAAFKIEQRGDTNRLYIIVNAMSDKDGEGEILCLFYLVRLLNGDYGLVREHDKEMLTKIHSWLETVVANNKPAQSRGSKFKRFVGNYLKSWVAGIAGLSKEVFKFYGDALSNDDAVKAFKRGFNGEGDEVKSYTVRNEMGCEETIYSSDGKLFYRENGEFVGESTDGGKTIIWR